MIQMLFRHVKYVVLPIIVGLILQGCSASMHPGVMTVKKPALDEQNEEIWFDYWEDQLDAKRGKVISPPMSYSAVAKSAYKRAAENWNLKVQEAKTQTYVAWIAVSGGLLIISYIIAFSNTPDTPSYTY